MLLLFHPREKNSRPPVSRTVRSPCASPRMKKVRAALTCPDSCFIFLFDLCSFSLFNCGLFLARWRKAVRTVRMRAGDKGAQGRREGGAERERESGGRISTPQYLLICVNLGRSIAGTGCCGVKRNARPRPARRSRRAPQAAPAA